VRTPAGPAVIAVNTGHAQRLQAKPRQPGKISPILSGPGGHKKTTGLRLRQLESGLHFFAHFKR